MSEVVREDQEEDFKNMNENDTLLPYSAAKDDDHYESWIDLNDDIAEVKRWMSGSILIDGMEVPKYGIMSLTAATTPMYIYSHPKLREVSNTAFTDGIHVFINVDFYQQLVNDTIDDDGETFGVELLIMHELMHVMFNHVRRLQQFPHDVANIAEDLFINTKLQVNYPDLKWCKTIRDIGYGFKEGDVEKYSQMSEETIAREVLKEREKKRQQDKKDGPGQGQQKSQSGQGQQPQKSQGQGQGGGSSQPDQQGGKKKKQEQGQGGQGQQNGQGQGQQNGQGQGGQKSDEQGQGSGDEQSNEWDNNHTITPEDLAKIFEENEMNRIKDKLNYPDSDNVEDIGKMQEEANMRNSENANKAAAQRAQLGGKYPGAHLADEVAESIKEFRQGKISWKLSMTEAVMGDGLHYRHDYENPGMEYFVDELAEAVGMEVYLGDEIPYKPDETVLFLIDTSGSVSEKQLRDFLSEALELKNASNGGDGASEVIILSGDTVLRGEPVEITDANVDQLEEAGINIYGRGGTNLEHTLNQTVNLPMMKDKKIKSVVFCTDLFDNPPRYENLKPGINYYFMAPEETDNTHYQEFKRAVEHYAEVVMIETGAELDLGQETTGEMSNKRRNRMGM